MDLNQDTIENEKPRSKLGTTSYASFEVSDLTESIVFNFINYRN